MFVSKYSACAAVLLMAVSPGLANRTPCSHDITMGEFGACVLGEAQKIHPELIGSNFSLQYLDPLPLGTYDIRTGDFFIKNKHSVMKGLSNTKMVDVSWDYDDNTAYITLNGNMTLSEDFKTSGSIMFLPVTSSGKLTVKIYDAKIIITYKFRKIVDNTGVERLETYNFSTSQEYGLLQFSVNTGNRFVDGIMNAVMNYYWRTLAPIGCAKVAQLIADQIGESTNKIFGLVPYNELKDIV